MVFLFALHILFFSVFAFFVAALPENRREVYFFSYLSVILIVGGFLGNAYSLPIADGVFVSGGNLAYGAFMMTSIIFVLVDRDIFILRRLIKIVISVDIFNIILSRLIIYSYSLPGVSNPHKVPSALFEVSIPLIMLGGLLITCELVFILFIFELLKKSFFPLSIIRAACALVFVAVVTFDGLAFPFIALGTSQAAVNITIGGFPGKFLIAASFGTSLLLFIYLFPTRFLEYVQTSVFSWRTVLYTSGQIIQDLARKDEQLKEAARLAEENIRANEERFQLVTKAVGSAVWDWDAASNQQWWSDGLREIFGHEADPSNSEPTVWKRHIHPDDAAHAIAAFERLKLGHYDFMLEQYRFQRTNGNWADVENKAFSLRDRNGAVIRIFGSLTDITEQKQMQESLLQAQKMEIVGQLTGGVAHDFNNLLTIIMGNAEILEEKLREQPNLHKMAKMSLDAAERGAELTARLLAFSRKQTLRSRVIDVAQLVQGMDRLLRGAIPESIDIEIRGADDLWKIEADGAQLESALLNLGVNARDAMQIGGRLTIEASNATIDHAHATIDPALKPGQYVVISVTDTGHGIPEEHLSRIFEPFYTTKEVGKGSGLGLSMVFGFVNQSGGHVQVHSTPCEGSSFKLYFPRSLKVEHSTTANLTRRKIASGSETVLVVEDDRSVRDYVTAILTGLGYGILEASDGAQALEIIRQDIEIDLLFTDVVMPGGMNGRELAEFASALRPSLKILITTGYEDKTIVSNGLLYSGLTLLQKPYKREELAAKLREVLES